LAQLCDEIDAAARQNGYEIDVCFVDDGSADGSWSVIQQLARSRPTVRGLRFRRNFGKSAALAAGIRRASADWIVTLDADLQDNIAELPKLLAKAQEGYDLVNGWKVIRRDPLRKRLASKVFNWLVNRASGLRLHDHNCGFKLFRRELYHDLRLYGEWHRFVPMLAASRGWHVAEVEVDHRKRQHGKSKYGFSRFVQGSLDLITIAFLSSHQHRPQRFLGYLGLLASGVGLAGMIYLAIYWLLRITSFPDWIPLHERPLLYYCLGALLVGVHLLTLGFLAELIVANRAADRLDYSIAEETDAHEAIRSPDPSIAPRRHESIEETFSRTDRPITARQVPRT
jgi:dolichol-phosphate mannosyltransferase